jgi:hypothetical protein
MVVILSFVFQFLFAPQTLVNQEDLARIVAKAEAKTAAKLCKEENICNKQGGVK